ncbi:MAG: hypothetical protein ACLU4N_00550 [Butyricimonas faecihominis]
MDNFSQRFSNTDKLKKISEALRHMNEENYNKQEDSPLPHYEEGESINRIWAVRSLVLIR